MPRSRGRRAKVFANHSRIPSGHSSSTHAVQLVERARAAQQAVIASSVPGVSTASK